MAANKQLHALVFLLSYLVTRPAWFGNGASSAAQEIRKGFSVTHDSSYSEFQSLLADPTGVFSLGFLRVDSSQLDLAVIHLPSSSALWRANPARPLLWSASASLSFDGSLVLSDSRTGVLWSTATADGDRLVLLNSSNLQIQKMAGAAATVLWQSFDFPSDTLVQDQNFTSTAALFSKHQRFSMRLGASYFALYMDLDGGSTPVMYWKHSALDVKVLIVPDDGPIYARVDPHGFLGMYQKEAAPVDVFPFDSFNREISGLRRLTLESDGNLRAYYWNGSIWVRDLETIAHRCELPAVCGAYGLCNSADSRCSCLDNSTEEGCLPPGSGHFCGDGGSEFRILRRNGVDLANQELVAYRKVASLEECEGSCEQNCSCWGAIYHNASGFCYPLDYPIQTLVEGDMRREGYFKVRVRTSGGGGGAGRTARVALLVVGSVVFAGAALFGAYSLWSRRRQMRAGMDGSMVEGLAPGSYKDLNSASFRSLELSNSFSLRK
ncbi:PAN domain-containing protein At5g03700-like [Musa acuminata AAA Group]|uniref:PAN domain-containing protein At5g03700-like n=1 Tax=Musa acuminata AAA Group TaxID=214697 RepID=UPI0031D983B6